MTIIRRAMRFGTVLVLLLCGAPHVASVSAASDTQSIADDDIERTPQARALARYNSQIARVIHGRIQRSWKALPRDIAGGVAIVEFKIKASGVVVSSSLVRTSDSNAIDRAALDAVKAGTNLPPFTPQMGVNSLVVTVPLRFKPKRP